MKVIAYLLGFGIIGFNACLILYTQATVAALNGLFQKYPLRYLSALPAIFGFLFLICASSITYPWVFRIVGLLSMGEAVLAYTNPQGIYSRMLNWYFIKVSDQAQRLFGIIGIIFGTAILSWII
ncbi:MAG: hypothetical protein C4519_25185 [Desulfobacteraceae bacterium]|nr:MAG: hypothetical protein C4519_25185 [Desulfobacteraceae bacterium]